VTHFPKGDTPLKQLHKRTLPERRAALDETIAQTLLVEIELGVLTGYGAQTRVQAAVVRRANTNAREWIRALATTLEGYDVILRNAVEVLDHVDEERPVLIRHRPIADPYLDE